MERIARAIVGRDRARFQPTGAYAANLLGLSDQVPAKVVFLTDGASRTVKIGERTLQLRHATPKNMASAGRLSGSLIQALRHVGREHWTRAQLDHLRRIVPASERRVLLDDVALAPTRMQPIFRALAAEAP